LEFDKDQPGMSASEFDKPVELNQCVGLFHHMGANSPFSWSAT
jgi:hypothetical protein